MMTINSLSLKFWHRSTSERLRYKERLLEDFFCTLSFFMETADKNDVFGKSVLRLDGKTGTDS